MSILLKLNYSILYLFGLFALIASVDEDLGKILYLHEHTNFIYKIYITLSNITMGAIGIFRFILKYENEDMNNNTKYLTFITVVTLVYFVTSYFYIQIYFCLGITLLNVSLIVLVFNEERKSMQSNTVRVQEVDIENQREEIPIGINLQTITATPIKSETKNN